MEIEFDEIVGAINSFDGEQIGQLMAAAKPLQAERDRVVSKALTTYAEKHGVVEETPDDKAAKVEAALERKQALFDLSIQRGLDPKAIIGLFDESLPVEDRLDLLGEYGKGVEHETQSRILGKYGRELDERPKLAVPSDDEILANPERYTPDIVSEAISRISAKRKNPTIRQTIERGMQ